MILPVKVINSPTALASKIQGTVYPIVDYGKGYIGSISEANAVGEFMTITVGSPLFNTTKLVEAING